jgi:hypothetical protein
MRAAGLESHRRSNTQGGHTRGKEDKARLIFDIDSIKLRKMERQMSPAIEKTKGSCRVVSNGARSSTKTKNKGRPEHCTDAARASQLVDDGLRL